MEFIASLLTGAIFFILHLLLMYYIPLFKKKRDEYYREELISLESIIPSTFKEISGGETGRALAMGTVALVIVYFFSYLGGIVNESHAESYLFHSAFLMIAFALGYRPLANLLNEKSDSLTPFLRQEKVFLVVLASLLNGVNFAAWGSHAGLPDSIGFFWVLLQTVITTGLLVWYILKEKADQPIGSDQTDESSFAYEADDAGPEGDEPDEVIRPSDSQDF